MVTTEDFRHSEIGDLNMSIVRHQNVLQFDVPVGNAVLMQVIDAPQYLLEDAVPVLSLEVFPLDQAKQLTLLAVLHDMVPTPIVRAQSNRPHNVGMIG